MDFRLTDEQLGAASVAAEIFEAVSGSRVDTPPPPTGLDWFDRATWKAVSEANLLGLELSDDVGGSGLSILETTSVLIEQGKHLARLPLAATTGIAAPALDRFGDKDLRRSVLPGVVEGRTVLTAALSEPASYDPFAVTTSAQPREDGGWSIDGEKTCVPFGQVADLVLVPARTGDHESRVFVVDPRAPGVEIVEQSTTHGQPECGLIFDDVLVGGDALLVGDEDVHQWLVQRGILAACAVQLGVAEQALALTASYTSERQQFGKPLAMFQAVALRAADAYLAVETIRSTLWQAAWLLSVGRPVGMAAEVAKFWAAEAGERVTASAQQLHGGMGVDTDYPLHRYTLWSKYHELTLGSGHQYLARIGAELAAGGVA